MKWKALPLLTLLFVLPRLVITPATAQQASSVNGAQASTSASAYPARIDNTDYRGWKAYRLTNGLVSLYVVPEIGGRAIQLQIGDRELFFVNPLFAGKVLPESENNPQAGFANYGGAQSEDAAVRCALAVSFVESLASVSSWAGAGGDVAAQHALLSDVVRVVANVDVRTPELDLLTLRYGLSTKAGSETEETCARRIVTCGDAEKLTHAVRMLEEWWSAPHSANSDAALRSSGDIAELLLAAVPEHESKQRLDGVVDAKNFSRLCVARRKLIFWCFSVACASPERSSLTERVLAAPLSYIAAVANDNDPATVQERDMLLPVVSWIADRNPAVALSSFLHGSAMIAAAALGRAARCHIEPLLQHQQPSTYFVVGAEIIRSGLRCLDRARSVSADSEHDAVRTKSFVRMLRNVLRRQLCVVIDRDSRCANKLLAEPGINALIVRHLLLPFVAAKKAATAPSNVASTCDDESDRIARALANVAEVAIAATSSSAASIFSTALCAAMLRRHGVGRGATVSASAEASSTFPVPRFVSPCFVGHRPSAACLAAIANKVTAESLRRLCVAYLRWQVWLPQSERDRQGHRTELAQYDFDCLLDAFCAELDVIIIATQRQPPAWITSGVIYRLVRMLSIAAFSEQAQLPALIPAVEKLFKVVQQHQQRAIILMSGTTLPILRFDC